MSEVGLGLSHFCAGGDVSKEGVGGHLDQVEGCCCGAFAMRKAATNACLEDAALEVVWGEGVGTHVSACAWFRTLLGQGRKWSSSVASSWRFWPSLRQLRLHILGPVALA